MQFTIGRLMLAVAVAGVFFVILRTPNTTALTATGVLIFAPLLIASVSPFFARPNRRLLIATWVASLWPLSIPWSLHAAWTVAYFFLGHSPWPVGKKGFVIEYSFLGHSPWPVGKGYVIVVLANSVAIVFCLALFSTIFCLLLQLYPVSGESIEVGMSPVAKATPILLMPLVWYSVVMIWQRDPLGAVKWFMN